MSQVQTAKGSANGGSVALPFITPDWANIQRIVTSATSAQSAAITSHVIQVRSDVACFISIGANPTATIATASSFPLAANELLTIPITSGHRVAAITSGAAGVLYVMPART